MKYEREDCFGTSKAVFFYEIIHLMFKKTNFLLEMLLQ